MGPTELYSLTYVILFLYAFFSFFYLNVFPDNFFLSGVTFPKICTVE